MTDILTLSNDIVGLAPMEGVTDFATRLWFAKVSAPAFCWTPFYRATYTSYSGLPELYAPELFQLKNYLNYTLIPQVMTGEIDHFGMVADSLLKVAPFIDLNCGCPSSKVVGRGSGSSVLETADKFHALVGGISSRIGPDCLSVKMRLGYELPEELPRLLEAIQSIDLKRVTIHGRTRPQKYSGEADWNLIREASEKGYFPIVGSGDIFSAKIFYQRIQETPNLEKIIIGRGALRNPWIFHEIRTKNQPFLNIETIIYAFSCFAVLHEMQKNSISKLFKLVRTGAFQQSLPPETEPWKEFYCALTSVSIGALVLSPFAFCRLKMLWNSLRLNMPEAFLDPSPLRAKNMQAWVEAVRYLAIKAPSQWHL